MAAETSTDALVATGVRTYVPNYAPKPVVFDHGEGARLWDIDGANTSISAPGSASTPSATGTRT